MNDTLTPPADTPVNNHLNIVQTLEDFVKRNDRGKIYGSAPDNMGTTVEIMSTLVSSAHHQVPANVMGSLHMVIMKLVRIMQSNWMEQPHLDSYLDAMNYLAIMYDAHTQTMDPRVRPNGGLKPGSELPMPPRIQQPVNPWSRGVGQVQGEQDPNEMVINAREEEGYQS